MKIHIGASMERSEGTLASVYMAFSKAALLERIASACISWGEDEHLWEDESWDPHAHTSQEIVDFYFQDNEDMGLELWEDEIGSLPTDTLYEALVVISEAASAKHYSEG